MRVYGKCRICGRKTWLDTESDPTDPRLEDLRDGSASLTACKGHEYMGRITY